MSAIRRRENAISTKLATQPVQAHVYQDDNIDKKLEFVLCMYGIKYEEKKTFNARISDIVKRFFSKKSQGVAGDQRGAFLLTKKVSFSPFLNGVRPLTWSDVTCFKNALESFAHDVTEIINGPPNNKYCLATRAFQFQKEWNQLVGIMKGQFLEGFGDILVAELRLVKPYNVLLFLTKLRKAQNVPKELDSLHDRSTHQAIVTSIEAYVDFQTRMADDDPPPRRRRRRRRRRRVIRRVIVIRRQDLGQNS